MRKVDMRVRKHIQNDHIKSKIKVICSNIGVLPSNILKMFEIVFLSKITF